VAGDIGASFNIYYDVIFPTSSSTTAGRTFSGCASLISITLPNATFGITNSIFRECTNLKTLSLPSDSTNTQINSIDSYAFEHCESLSVSGIIALGNKIDTSNLDFVQNGTSGAAIFRKDNFSSPSSGHNALLAGNVGTSLNSYFTDTIKNFYNLASLTGVDLGTFSIDGNAFNGCTKLNTLY
jgi:hypothetical protein